MTTCCTHHGINCRQGRECPERYGWPTTLRYSRTLQQAFGPYTTSQISEHKPSLVERFADFIRRIFA